MQLGEPEARGGAPPRPGLGSPGRLTLPTDKRLFVQGNKYGSPRTAASRVGPCVVRCSAQAASGIERRSFYSCPGQARRHPVNRKGEHSDLKEAE
jgi:hypothetical protein